MIWLFRRVVECEKCAALVGAGRAKSVKFWERTLYGSLASYRYYCLSCAPAYDERVLTSPGNGGFYKNFVMCNEDGIVTEYTEKPKRK